MNKVEFYKVALASSLLFLCAYASLYFHKYAGSDLKHIYENFDLLCWCYIEDTLNPFKEPMIWYVQRQSIYVICVCLILIIAIRPKFHLVINLIWISYFVMIAYSYSHSYGHELFRLDLNNREDYFIGLDQLMSIIQFLYVVYCFFLWKKDWFKQHYL